MIRINQMKLNIEHTSDDFERKILKTLCIKKEAGTKVLASQLFLDCRARRSG